MCADFDDGTAGVVPCAPTLSGASLSPRHQISALCMSSFSPPTPASLNSSLADQNMEAKILQWCRQICIRKF